MNFKETIKNFLSKIPAFFSGFLLGVVLTGSFFLFKINEYLIQLKENFYPKITVIEKKENTSDKKDKTRKQKTVYKDISDKNSKDTTITFNSEQQENTDVLQEKIISEKSVRIIKLDTPTDSSFAQLADVPQYLKDSEIKIIFKKTPFNNKGYYFDDNQLLLFGLEDIPYINVYEYKNELYIKYDKAAFKLSYTNTFQPFIQVHDQTLLAKMN